MKKSIYVLILTALMALRIGSADAQNGYIYLHKKTLNEESSPGFTFSVTGGPTSVSSVILNDQPPAFQNTTRLGGDAGGGSGR